MSFIIVIIIVVATLVLVLGNEKLSYWKPNSNPLFLLLHAPSFLSLIFWDEGSTFFASTIVGTLWMIENLKVHNK